MVGLNFPRVHVCRAGTGSFAPTTVCDAHVEATALSAAGEETEAAGSWLTRDLSAGGWRSQEPVTADTLTLDPGLYPPTPVLGPAQTGIMLSGLRLPGGLGAISAV